MVGALFAKIFDSKVVNHERKTYFQCRVLPDRRSARDRSITKLGKTCSEAVVGNAADLFETGHAISDFEVEPTSRSSKSTKFLLVETFGWKYVESELHTIKTLRGGVVVEVLDVKVK